MSEIKEPPKVSIQDTQMSDSDRDKIIEKWKEYLNSQKVIVVVDGEELLTYDPATKIVVRFPKSLFHIPDFKQGIGYACAEARFYEDGSVQIYGIQDGISTMNFDQAWAEIYRRTTGKDLEFIITSQIPEGVIAEDLEVKFTSVREKLNGWVEAFKKIPVVCSVEILEDNEYGSLIEIRLFTNGSFLLDKKNCEAVDDYRLRSSGYVSYAEYTQGESDSVYHKWCEDSQEKNADYENLSEFYQAVLDLNNRYMNAVPDVPKK